MCDNNNNNNNNNIDIDIDIDIDMEISAETTVEAEESVLHAEGAYPTTGAYSVVVGTDSSWSGGVIDHSSMDSNHDDDDDDDDEDNWSRQVETDDAIQRTASSVTGGETNTIDGDEDGGQALQLLLSVSASGTLLEENCDDDGTEEQQQQQMQRRGRQHKPALLLPQPQPLPTMKEQLVERERQRRVESERARWKRQFALAAHAESEDNNDEDENHSATNNNNSHCVSPGDSARNTHGYDGSGALDYSNADQDRSFLTDRNSVAGTVGEDTVAPIETLEEDDNNDSSMNYPMERFLKEQQGPEILEDSSDRNDNNNNTRSNINSNSNHLVAGNKKETTVTNQGVVMERFLQEQQPAAVTVSTNAFQAGVLTVAGSSPTSAMAPDSSLPGDSEAGLNNNSNSNNTMIGNELLPLIGSVPSNNSMATNEINLSGEPMMPDDNAFQSPLSQQPRVVLRLTEAEIQEMAAIDDASRSNAPPSERDDMSELGELVSEFGAIAVHIDHQNMSQGTPVTAIESVTSSVGGTTTATNQIGRIMVLNDGSGSSHSDNTDGIIVDDIEGRSISSNNVVASSSAGGDVSLTGNPPSDIARDDDDDAGGMPSPRSSLVPTEILPIGDVSLPLFPTAVDAAAASIPNNNDAETELKLTVMDETIVNRTMRPGLFNYKQGTHQTNATTGNSATAIEKTLREPSTPNKNTASAETENNNCHIEGFDFDKNDDVSSPQQGDVVGTRNDLWSPGFSPRQLDTASGDSRAMPEYGATTKTTTIKTAGNGVNLSHRLGEGDRKELDFETTKTADDTAGSDDSNESVDETKALLKGVLDADNANANHPHHHRRESPWKSLRSLRNRNDLNSLAESVFRDIRSEGTAAVKPSGEAETCADGGTLQRTFPDKRTLALVTTLVLELPTLFLVSGGSDELCALIGRERHTAVLALLPIVSAISGNAGLQASSLTKRAIVHGRVQTMDTYGAWLGNEIGAAFYLGEFCRSVEAGWLVSVTCNVKLSMARSVVAVFLVCSSSPPIGRLPKVNFFIHPLTPLMFFLFLSCFFFLPFSKFHGCYPGLTMGAVTGVIALAMGGFSFPFALSMFTAQFVGVFTAAFTGSLSPLLLAFFFDITEASSPGRLLWGGPLITALQDVVASFAMIVLSYQILVAFGPYEIAPRDACYAPPAEY